MSSLLRRTLERALRGLLLSTSVVALTLFVLVAMSIAHQWRTEYFRTSLVAHARKNGGCASLLEVGLFQRGFAVHASTYFDFRVVELRGDVTVRREVPTAPGCEHAEGRARNRTSLVVVEASRVLGGTLQNVTLHAFASQCAQHANDLYDGIWSCAKLHKEPTL